MGLFSWLRRKNKNSSNDPKIAMAKATATLPSDRDDNFNWLEGRRIYTKAPYMLPKDLQEINRLDFQHYMLRHAIQSNYVAPIQHPGAILDVGCGTGRWCHEMAISFPHTNVMGVDLVVPTRDEQNGVEPWAPNCSFGKGNILEGLPFADYSFDFVHQRLLLFAIPANNWQQAANELKRVTTSGGWIELVEVASAFPGCGPATNQLVTWINEASKRRGIDTLIVTNIGGILQSTGMVNVTTRTLQLPIGSRGGRIGNMAQTAVNAVIQALKPMVGAQLGISLEEYDRLFSLMQGEWESYPCLVTFYFAYGQKP